MQNWAWWQQSTGPDDYRIRELLRAIWDLHAMYGDDQPWLWRGQANAAFNLEPGLHTRVRRCAAALDDATVLGFTDDLLTAARAAGLNRHENTNLPDMALLALLQHHGAATPLLDVTLDPVVGLYMAVVSPNAVDDDEDGVLFAIRRPNETIADFDSRTFATIYGPMAGQSVAFYSAPDVSERLRIQRGHFLMGAVHTTDPRTSIPLVLDPKTPVKGSWIWKRMDRRGKRGPVPPVSSDVASFRVPSGFKSTIRDWLEARSGLTRDFIYPTPWHQPYLDRFATAHGRMADF
jgi:hypothetical protein